MSAAAKPQLSLWMVLSVENGYHTAKGWAHSPSFAHLFTQDEAGAFIVENTSKHPNAMLLAVHYDARSAHSNVDVIGNQTKAGHHDLDDLNRTAQATIRNLRLDKQTAVVQMVGERTTPVSDIHLLDVLAKSTITRMGREPERVITRRFDASLAAFDRALEAYRSRLGQV